MKHRTQIFKETEPNEKIKEIFNVPAPMLFGTNIVNKYHTLGVYTNRTAILEKIKTNMNNPALQAAIKVEKPIIYNKYVQIRSRHPSHDVIRHKLRTRLPIVVRLGSVKDMPSHYSINTVEAVTNSANKLLMKRCFDAAGVKTAVWCYPENKQQLEEWCNTNIKEDKIIVKSLRGSRGKGLYLFNNKQEVLDWFTARRDAGKNNYGMYIVEKYYNYTREYRLHVTADGCFYTCRKMLKNDIPENLRWFRNDSNSVWVLEENPQFDKPVNWKDVVTECVKALNAVGLSIGACDLRIQGSKQKEPQFIICEINSAPSFGEKTAEKYLIELQKIADFINKQNV